MAVHLHWQADQEAAHRPLDGAHACLFKGTINVPVAPDEGCPLLLATWHDIEAHLVHRAQH